jgi:hypothetical protein
MADNKEFDPSAMQFGSSKQIGQAPAVEEFDPSKIDLGGSKTIEPKLTPITDIKRDILESAKTQAAKTIPGIIAGGIGSTEEALLKDIPTFARNAYNYGREKLDYISPNEKERLNTEPLYRNETPAQEAGRMSPLGSPTYKGVTDFMKEYGKQNEVPLLTREPETHYGKMAQEATEMGLQSAVGPMKGIVGRIASGAGSGAASEALGQYYEGKPEEPFARIAGVFGGGYLANKVTNAVRAVAPGITAQQQLAEAISRDMLLGQGKMTPQQVEEAIAAGKPITILDMAGPNTMRLIESNPDLSRQNLSKIGDLNKFLDARDAGTFERTKGKVSQIFDRDVDAIDLTKDIERAGKLERDRVYEIARDTQKNPLADNLFSHLFSDITDRPVVRSAMADAEEQAKNLPGYNIRPPKAGTPERITPVNTGVVDEYGAPIIRQNVTPAVEEVPGNLQYWDQVKRSLDREIALGQRANDPSRVAAAQEAKSKLVARLDAAVEDYKNARDVASETFKAASAPEAGYKFFGNMNDFKRSEIKDVWSKYNDAQKELFGQGFAHRLIEDTAKNPDGMIAKFNNPQFRDRAKMVLGEEKFNALHGHVIGEGLMRDAERINLGKVASPTSAGVATTGAITAIDAIHSIIHNQTYDPTHLGPTAAIGVGVAAGKYFFDAMERRVADKLIPLVTSTDPADAARFARLVTEHPLSAHVFSKLTNAIRNAANVAEEQFRNQPQEPDRTARKSGGRVERNHEADADKLITLAERAKKFHQKATEPLLNLSDNTVAKALQVANQQI